MSLKQFKNVIDVYEDINDVGLIAIDEGFKVVYINDYANKELRININDILLDERFEFEYQFLNECELNKQIVKCFYGSIYHLVIMKLEYNNTIVTGVILSKYVREYQYLNNYINSILSFYDELYIIDGNDYSFRSYDSSNKNENSNYEEAFKLNLDKKVLEEDKSKYIKYFSLSNILKLKQNQIIEQSIRILQKNRIFWKKIRVSRVDEINGQINYLLGISDITKEKKIIESKKRNEEVINSISSDFFSVFVVDLLNDTFDLIRSSDLYKKTTKGITSFKEAEAVFNRHNTKNECLVTTKKFVDYTDIKKRLKINEKLEYIYQLKDGTWLQRFILPIKNEDYKAIYATKLYIEETENEIKNRMFLAAISNVYGFVGSCDEKRQYFDVIEQNDSIIEFPKHLKYEDFIKMVYQRVANSDKDRVRNSFSIENVDKYGTVEIEFKLLDNNKKIHYYFGNVTKISSEYGKRYIYMFKNYDKIHIQAEKENMLNNVITLLSKDYFYVAVCDIDTLKYDVLRNESFPLPNKYKSFKDFINYGLDIYIKNDYLDVKKKLSDFDWVSKQFLLGKEELEFVYRSIENKWRKVHLVPMPSFSINNKKIIFAIKSFDDEMGKKTEDDILKTAIFSRFSLVAYFDTDNKKYTCMTPNQNILDISSTGRYDDFNKEMIFHIYEDDLSNYYSLFNRDNLIKNKVVDGQIRFWDKDYSKYQYYALGMVLVNYNEYENIVLMARNIDAEKQTELKQAKKETEMLAVIQKQNFDLEEALDESRRLTNTKSEFLSYMSHEIRTPMNAIIGLSELALGEKMSNEARMNVEKINESSGILLSIINDILDFSKIDSGKFDIVNDEYDIIELISDVYRVLTIKNEKNINVVEKTDPNLPRILIGDRIRVRQIIVNIMGNALKYTKQGSIFLEVNCKIVDDTANLIISIIDTGIGIKKEDIPHLFDSFSRVDLVKNKSIEGTGLGLAICKKLLDLMDGSISVESTYGVGSTFTVNLPQKIAKNQSEFLNKSNYVMTDYRDKKFIDAPRLLVVDDNETNLLVMKGFLKKFNIDADYVLSGFECIKMVQKRTYGLIFLDHMMPNMDGVETLHKLFQIEEFDSPVIAFTANAIAGEKEKYFKEGFTDYITKPIDSSKLYNILLTYLDCEVVSSDSKNEMNLLFINNEIQLKEAMDNLDNDMDLYRQLANIFLNNINGKIQEAKLYIKEKNLDSYTIFAHSLKSDARLLGANKLGELAFEHEKASKDGNYDFVRNDFSHLIEETKKNVEYVKKIIE